ncbi:MAG: prolyl oligopeptidase family serine peptidase, partial [Opitutaceae bacterium]
GKPWAFAGAVWPQPAGSRCLIRLSPGGGDASEVREFDLETLAFVAGGFALSAAKSRIAWLDPDTLFVGTDFGAGSLTNSGYPRAVKRWRRGTPLAAADKIYEAPAESIAVSAQRLRSAGSHVDLVTESSTFWTSKHFQIDGPELRALQLPERVEIADAFRGQLVVWLKEDWSTHGEKFPAGSVAIAHPSALRGGAGSIELLVAATAGVVVTDVTVTSAGILVATLDNVCGRLQRVTPDGQGWKRVTIAFPDNGTLKIVSTDDATGDAWIQFESFTTPPSLYFLPANSTMPERIKSQAPTFDGARFAAQQLWCTSADGTRVPYFVVGAKDLKYDGTNPVWMFSYGGFENALTPSYSGSYEQLHGAYGKLWLERGGVFVLANIRGGGEFGPAWHNAALKENREKAFEDFEAVARDLAARKITSPRHLGIEGRSNGGLLVAATMLRHPELYGAVVCGNPLADMQRYHRLLAGASWVAEYGDPDRADEWAYISRYSPYQKLRLGQKLPPVIFYTSTHDDRVHPGHARKMAAKMEALGYATEYYENTDGGHHGSVTNEQLATRLARTYAFLWAHLKQR